MRNKINYVSEPKDGMELPDAGFEVIARNEQRASDFPGPPPSTMGYEQTEKAGIVTLRPLHGGRRDGAGRKPTGNVRMQLSVSTSTRKKIQRLAKKRDVTFSEVVEQAVAAL
jgi:hypothetical protein